MFRHPRYLEKTVETRFNLDTPILLPGNNESQEKTGYMFQIKDRNSWYDWNRGYFRVEFSFEASADGGNVDADTRSAPINGAFSLINKIVIKSGGKAIYNADNVHRAVFIKNLLKFSDDYSRSTAREEFWYLDTDDSNVTAAAGTNSGIKARAALSQAGARVKTTIPLKMYSFFEELEDKLLPPLPLQFEIQLQSDREFIWQNDGTARRFVVRKLELWVPRLRFTSEGQKIVNENFLKPMSWSFLSEIITPSASQREAFGEWQISPGIKNAKHVFVYFQRTNKTNAYTQNPYFFDTFKINHDNNNASLSTCKLEYGNEFYPELDFDENHKNRIYRKMLEYNFRGEDYNSGCQLNLSSFETLYPVIYFDLRENKNNITNDPQKLIFHYRLNQAATSDYTIFAAVLYETELVIKQIGNELAVV